MVGVGSDGSMPQEKNLATASRFTKVFLPIFTLGICPVRTNLRKAVFVIEVRGSFLRISPYASSIVRILGVMVIILSYFMLFLLFGGLLSATVADAGNRLEKNNDIGWRLLNCSVLPAPGTMAEISQNGYH